MCSRQNSNMTPQWVLCIIPSHCLGGGSVNMRCYSHDYVTLYGKRCAKLLDFKIARLLFVGLTYLIRSVLKRDEALQKRLEVWEGFDTRKIILYLLGDGRGHRARKAGSFYNLRTTLGWWLEGSSVPQSQGTEFCHKHKSLESDASNK